MHRKSLVKYFIRNTLFVSFITYMETLFGLSGFAKTYYKDIIIRYWFL